MYKIKLEKGNELKCYKHILNYQIINKIHRFFMASVCNLLPFLIFISYEKKIFLYIFILNFFIALFFLGESIYINKILRKAVKKVPDFSSTAFITDVKIEKVVERKISQYYQKDFENYLKICYIKSEDGKLQKYYYILTKPDYEDKSPSKGGICNIHIYKGSNIIKKFETWISPYKS